MHVLEKKPDNRYQPADGLVHDLQRVRDGARQVALPLQSSRLARSKDRVWALRGDHTTYDACYLTLAEALSAPLYTCDRKLVDDGHAAQVRLFPRTH